MGHPGRRQGKPDDVDHEDVDSGEAQDPKKEKEEGCHAGRAAPGGGGGARIVSSGGGGGQRRPVVVSRSQPRAAEAEEAPPQGPLTACGREAEGGAAAAGLKAA